MDIYINIRSSYYYPQYVNATIYRALLLLAIQFESNRRVFFFFRLLLNIVYTHLECIWCKIWFLYCVYRLLYPSFVRRPAHTKDDVFNELFDARLQPRRFVVRAQESIIIWEKKKRGALSHIALEEARNFCIVCVHLRFFHPRRRRRFRRRYYYQHTTTPNNNNNIKNIERGERKRVDKETFPPFFDLVLLPTQINKFAYSSSSYFHWEIYLLDLLNILRPHSTHFFLRDYTAPPFDHIP